MRVQPHADFPRFATTVLPWLAREPVLNNVLSTVVDSRAGGTRSPENDRAG